jgi:hypothetical protein
LNNKFKMEKKIIILIVLITIIGGYCYAIQTSTINNHFDEFKINGREPIYDSLFSHYFVVVPPSTLKNSKTFTITYRKKEISDNIPTFTVIDTTSDKTNDFTVDDSLNQDTITLMIDSIHPNKECTIRMKYDSCSIPIVFTTLPIIEFNGIFSDTLSWGKFRITDTIGASRTFDIQSRWRGHTARTYEKKSYAVKFYNNSKIAVDSTNLDTSFLGLREDNSWILSAMACDSGRIRNMVSTDLWLDFSTHPYYFANEPNAVNGARGKYVELILNGKYNGIYCLEEKVDRKQLKLKKYQEKDSLIRGELFKGSNTTEAVENMRCDSLYDNSVDLWEGWETIYPKLEDEEKIDYEPLYKAINIGGKSNDSIFSDSISIYFDIPVILDYGILCELICASDNYDYNAYFSIYNKNNNPMFSITPWDMDATWGRWAGNDSYKVNWTMEWEYEGNILNKRLRKLNWKSYMNLWAKRYRDLRKSSFNEDSIANRFVNYYSQLKTSGAAEREYVRWNIENFDEELNYLLEWTHGRLEFLDKKYATDAGVFVSPSNQPFRAWCYNRYLYIDCDGDMETLVYSANGRLLYNKKIKDGESCIGTVPKGILIVNGKKIISQ